MLSLIAAVANSRAAVTIELLGYGTEFLLGGDLTDPENDGNEAAGPNDPSWNWKSISSNNEPGFQGGEFSYNVFDNLLGPGNDKWCCDDATEDAPKNITVEFARQVRLTHFTISSANDAPERDPLRWAILGSNDGETFTVIYAHDSEESLWPDRLQVNLFTLDAPAEPYRFIRFEATHTAGPLFQVGEIEYFGDYVAADGPVVVGVATDVGFLSIRVEEEAGSALDPASARLTLDGQQVTVTSEKTGNVTTFTYTPASPFPPLSDHTFSFEVSDAGGNSVTEAGSFSVAAYARLTPDLKVTADTSMPGFIWNVHQNGAFTATDNTRPLNQLAGLLGVNLADPDAQGIAIAPGTPGATDRLPIRFEIATVINMSQIEGDANGEFTPDDQMPGIPGLGETAFDDGIAGEILTFLDLSAGFHTLIVNSDDGFRTTAGNVYDIFDAQVAGEFNGGRGAADTVYRIYVEEAGVYPFRTVWQEGGGGANIEWKSENEDGTRVLINDTDNGGIRAYRASSTGTPTAITRVTPAINAPVVAPNTPIEAVITIGTTPVDTASIRLALDGANVTPTINETNGTITVTYQPASEFAADSSHTVRLTFTHGGTERTEEWSFRVPPFTRDVVGGRAGFILGTATFTTNQGGRTGEAGDFAIDLGLGGGNQSVYVLDATFLNAAAEDDTMSFSVWQKLHEVANSSLFWANSPGSSGNSRGWQAHTPWGDSGVIFDTAGCCDATTQRIGANIDTFPDYSGEQTWWQDWHHFVFTKNADVKQIWIDGQLFLEGSNVNPLPTDFTSMYIGAETPGTANNLRGIVDDFAVYSGALSEADIGRLADGAAPDSVTGLVALWNFNDATEGPSDAPRLIVTQSGANLTITSDPQPLPNGWVIQRATSITGPWTTQAGDTTPLTVPIGTDAALFLRAAQP